MMFQDASTKAGHRSFPIDFVWVSTFPQDLFRAQREEGAMMPVNAESLSTVVQRNCHITDARHASNYSLCVYLLKMREYYRWEKGYPFDTAMPRDEIGDWLTQREQLWEMLEEQPYAPIPLQEREVDPFDTATINAELLPQGYVYSGGIGHRATAHFFLGRLERHLRFEGFEVLIAADEYARDLTAPPALALGKTIFIRRESLKRMLWEKVQEWRWNRYDNAMARALSYYDFDGDLDRGLEEMTRSELDAVTHHEIGEVRAGEHLGEAWGKMLLALPHSRAEIMARAVRDHLADALATLPRLLETRNEASLHFYMANLSAMRRELAPGFTRAYAKWLEHHELGPIARIAEQGREHWLALARRMLELYARRGTDCLPEMERLVESSHL
jgi:hypothetical protein